MSMDYLSSELLHPREQITIIIKRIYKSGMTTTSGGNISIQDESGDVWVTPAAIDKGSLTQKDIMCVRTDGTIKGHHRPSSEYPFHRAIYQRRSDIRAIIHAHPPALVSFSIVRDIPNTNVIPQAKKVCGPIGYATYELPGSSNLGDRIAEQFEKGFNAVIMENHGIVVGGKDLQDAYQRFETLEFCAKTIIGANTVGIPEFLSDEMIESFENQIPHDLEEQTSVEHPSDERKIRSNICKLVRRACDQGLMISTYGTLSVRWRDNDFLITPTDVPRWNLQLEDVVQIKDGKREPGKLPSRSVRIHQEIYKRNPSIKSIILAQPPNIMAFGVTETKLDVRTIPESWVFLQDIPAVPFGSQFAGETIIPDLFEKDVPAVIIRNDSIIVTGENHLHAFDRLEVAEFSAKSLIQAKSLGEMMPISDVQIAELKANFLS